jgi:hypothetical protein
MKRNRAGETAPRRGAFPDCAIHLPCDCGRAGGNRADARQADPFDPGGQELQWVRPPGPEPAAKPLRHAGPPFAQLFSTPRWAGWTNSSPAGSSIDYCAQVPVSCGRQWCSMPHAVAMLQRSLCAASVPPCCSSGCVKRLVARTCRSGAQARAVAVERAVFLAVLHRLMRGGAVGSRGCPNSTQSHTRFPPSAQARPGTNQWPRHRCISAVACCDTGKLRRCF